MPRPRPVDDEGKPISSVQNLSGFLERVGASDPEPETPQTPSWESVVFEAEDPALKGKTGKEVADALADTRRQAEEAQRRAYELEVQLHAANQQRQMEETARRVMQEQQAKPQPEEPREDPRVAQVREMWLTDPPAAHQLLEEINTERRQRELEAVETRAEQRVFQRLTVEQVRARTRDSFENATNRLIAEGVPMAQLERVAKHVLAEVSVPGQYDGAGRLIRNKYYDTGGPTNPDNLVNAYHELFGAPMPTQAATVVQSAPAQQQRQSAPPPPGSNRPAPAATATTGKQTHLPSNVARDYEHMAETFGYDAEKLKARARARMERDANV